jgi:muramidase (phage lysozyme)
MGRPVTPAERQWLNLISFAEGTWTSQGPKYNTMFGGGQFKDLSRHPDKVVRTPGYASAAAGAYQFMPGTWGGVSKKLGLRDFGPQAQDLAAIQLMRSRGVDPATAPITPANVAKLAPEWASLPTLRGGSYYGQPSKSFSTLANFVKKSGGIVPQNVGQYYSRSGGAQRVSSAAPESGDIQLVSATSTSNDEDALTRAVGQAVLGQILQGAGVKVPDWVAKGLTPPPIDTGDQEEVEDNTSTGSSPDLAALEESLKQAAYQEQVSRANQVASSNVANTQRMMQQLISNAQNAFKPGAPVF